MSINSLKLDHATAKYRSKGLLPYDKEICEPQTDLLLFIIEQNNSHEAINSTLSFNKVKGRNTILENLLIKLIIKAIEKNGSFNCEIDNFECFDLADSENDFYQIFSFWLHISSSALYFEFFYQNIHFPSFLNDLHDTITDIFKTQHQLSNKFLIKTRELFMWTIFQMLSDFIQKNTIDNLSRIFHLIEIFYPDKAPLPLPDLNKPNCIYIMAAASIWILVTKKAENEPIKFQRPIPIALKFHIEFLQELSHNPSLNSSNDFIIILLCNSCKLDLLKSINISIDLFCRFHK